MKIYHSFAEVSSLWKKHSSTDVLSQLEFFLSLEESGSIGEESGWIPVIIASEDIGLIYTFVKTHSYGEFIFDWQWANAFERHGIPYYPKLTSMAPLTPVNTNHFIMRSFSEEKAVLLLTALEDWYEKHQLSSLHFLFMNEEERPFFAKRGYLERETFQYHYTNKYQNFEDFLSDLKTKKAKNLRSERIFSDVLFSQFSGSSLLPEHADRMYEFYLATIDKKDGQAYLTQDFFKIIFEKMKDNILYVEASRGQPIAGSMFYFDEKRLLGRYYGALEEVSNLHFELCYYQGMDFCFKNSIPLFEAGAQGEHKIPRGFRPIKIYSAHKIKHQAFESAIANFLKSEKLQTEEIIAELSGRLPFKN